MLRNRLSLILPFVAFALFACAVLLGYYPDMLYTAQDHNEFFATQEFAQQTLHSPFGLLSYLGCYLTQFFYYPALGVGILLVLWALIYVLGLRLMRFGEAELKVGHAALALLPLACLLASLTEVGYWIYTLPLRGYWFSQTLACLVSMLLLWGAQATPVKYRSLWFVLAVIGLFSFTGWASMLFCLGMVAMQLASKPADRMPWYQLAGGILITIVWPLCVVRYLIFSDMDFATALKAALPYFENNTSATLHHSYPFMLLALSTLLLFFAHRIKLKAWMLGSAVAVVIVGMTYLFSFKDDNYLAEMRMNRAAMDDDWQSILVEASKTKTPSRTMVLLKNIALMNTGELGSRSFALENSGVEINNPDSLQINSMLIAAPMIYYNYGKVMYAIRWCMENTVGHGFSPYYLKLYVRCAQASGERKFMNRYLHMLGKTTFHDDWRPRPTTPVIRELQESFSDVIDSDHNNCERYLIENFSLAAGSSSPLVKDLNLFYAMIYRDPKLFWPAFHAFALMSKGANLPLHYQEAYLIMQQNFPAQLPYQVGITQAVSQNYKAFGQTIASLTQQGMSKEEIGAATRDAWHHTYWWYLMYGRTMY